jgi:uncharacterized protein
MGTRMREPSLEFDWDDVKAISNQHKHGISFAAAIAVFGDPHRLEVDDEVDGELRTTTVGRIPTPRGRQIVVVVIWTDRLGVIRIISARKAEKRERENYYARQATP